MMLAEAEELTDGRRRRSKDSRDRIVGAMLALVAEGAISPGAEEVAIRAGVGLRSVFRHFRDMESLYGELTVQLTRGYELWLVPFRATDWRGQLAETIDRRLTTYERVLPFKRAADAHRHRSPAIKAEYDRLRQMMRGRLEVIVGDVLAGDPLAIESLDLLLSVDSWLRLRFDQRLDPDTARAVIDRQVELLLRAVPDSPAVRRPMSA